MDSASVPLDSREPCAPDRALQDSGGTGVGRCAGVLRSSSNAMRRPGSAVVRQDSKATDVTNRARTATTVRTASRSASVRERRQRRAIEYQERASVIPDSPESSVMLYVPNRRSVSDAPRSALRRAVETAMSVTPPSVAATWIR